MFHKEGSTSLAFEFADTCTFIAANKGLVLGFE